MNCTLPEFKEVSYYLLPKKVAEDSGLEIVDINVPGEIEALEDWLEASFDRTINSPWGGFITIEEDEQLSFAPTVDESEDPRPLCTCDMDVILRKGCQCGGR